MGEQRQAALFAQTPSNAKMEGLNGISRRARARQDAPQPHLQGLIFPRTFDPQKTRHSLHLSQKRQFNLPFLKPAKKKIIFLEFFTILLKVQNQRTSTPLTLPHLPLSYPAHATPLLS